MKKKLTNYENLFYQALRVRKVEEKIIDLYPSDKIQSPVHLSIGQEHVAVGLCSNLLDIDTLFINYRCHAFYLAKGGCLKSFFAELFGKQDGISKGKAGSMHLSFKKKGVMGASAIVSSTISHGVGFALADKLRNKSRIVVTVFGDGATEQGIIHESLNFASLHKIPIIFLCENNHLAVHLSQNERQSYNICDLPKTYNIPYYEITKSYNLEDTYNKFSQITNDFRNNPRPIFIEIHTFRYKEHVGPNEDFHLNYRNHDDYLEWLSHDPLQNDEKLINKFSAEINQEIKDAVKFAENASTPNDDELLKDVL